MNDSFDWLKLPISEFKILILIILFKENDETYKGKLKDICDFFNISNCSKNTQKIKDALANLQIKGIITVAKDGHTLSIKLLKEIEFLGELENIRQILSIDKIGINKFQILKIYQLLLKMNFNISATFICSYLNISMSTCQHAILILRNLNMIDTKIPVGIIKERTSPISISYGQDLICYILYCNNIPFKQEYAVQINECYHRFDIAVYNEKGVSYFIEYDGPQHKKEVEEWGGAEELKERQFRDDEKNNWCRKNNFPLIRIPYSNSLKLSLADLIPDSSSFLI